MDEQAIRNLVKLWYARGWKDPDPFSKFVFLWICFNAWMAFESDEDYDRDMIDWLKRTPASHSRLRMAFDTARESEHFEVPLQDSGHVASRRLERQARCAHRVP